MDKTINLGEQCIQQFDKTKKLIERRQNSLSESRSYSEDLSILSLLPNWDNSIDNTKMKKFCSVNCNKNVYFMQSDAGNVVDFTDNNKTKLLMLIDGQLEIDYLNGKTTLLDNFQTVSIHKTESFNLNIINDCFIIVVEI